MKFERGFKPVRDKVSKGSKYTMSCYNCDYFYQTEEDEEEVCQNPNVLKYDMVVTTSSIYCNRWKMCKKKERVNSEREKVKIKKTRK